MGSVTPASKFEFTNSKFEVEVRGGSATHYMRAGRGGTVQDATLGLGVH